MNQTIANTNNDQAETALEPVDYTAANYPWKITRTHTAKHRRALCIERFVEARLAAGLTIEDVADRLRAEARAVDVYWHAGTAAQVAVVAAWEAGAIDIPAWAVFALASTYGADIESFSECLSCRRILVGVRS